MATTASSKLGIVTLRGVRFDWFSLTCFQPDRSVRWPDSPLVASFTVQHTQQVELCGLRTPEGSVVGEQINLRLF